MKALKNILKTQIFWFLSFCLIFTLPGLIILPARVVELKSAKVTVVSDQINNPSNHLAVSAMPVSFFGLLSKTLPLQPAENPDLLAVSGYGLQSGAVFEQSANTNIALIPTGVTKSNKTKQLVLEVLPLIHKVSFTDLNLASFFAPVNWSAGRLPGYTSALSILGAVMWFETKRFKGRTVIFSNSDGLGSDTVMFNRLAKPKTAVMRC